MDSSMKKGPERRGTI
jgi:hypothetical protein